MYPNIFLIQCDGLILRAWECGQFFERQTGEERNSKWRQNMPLWSFYKEKHNSLVAACKLAKIQQYKMDLLGSIMDSMDAPPTTENKEAKGDILTLTFF